MLIHFSKEDLYTKGMHFRVVSVICWWNWIKEPLRSRVLFLVAACFIFVLSCSSCLWPPQGVRQTDHFGFICRDQSETSPSQYACYVFQCASESLVSQASCGSETDSDLTCACCWSLCVSGWWGDADPEAGLLHRSSLTKQQDPGPALRSVPHARPAQALREDWGWAWSHTPSLSVSLLGYWCKICFTSLFRSLPASSEASHPKISLPAEWQWAGRDFWASSSKVDSC